MKRLYAIALGLILSVSSFAQGGHIQLTLSTNIGPNNSNKAEDIDFVPALDIKAAYMYPVGRLFEVGAGAGVGLSTLVHVESWGVVSDNGEVYNVSNYFSPNIPLFVIGKMKWFDGEDTPFVKLEAGHRLAWDEDNYKGHFNPYIFHVIPSLGYEVSSGKHAWAFELGIEYMWYKKTYQAKKSDYLLAGGELNISANNYNGVYLAVSYSF